MEARATRAETDASERLRQIRRTAVMAPVREEPDVERAAAREHGDITRWSGRRPEA
jgi:hypothetical protein